MDEGLNFIVDIAWPIAARSWQGVSHIRVLMRPSNWVTINEIIKSPMLVVDSVHGLDGKYTIIEFSPVCQMEKPEQLAVNGTPGAYIIENDGSIRFIEGKFWVHELAFKQFLLKDYLQAQGIYTG